MITFETAKRNFHLLALDFSESFTQGIMIFILCVSFPFYQTMSTGITQCPEIQDKSPALEWVRAVEFLPRERIFS
jgi:hypothetical protein